MHIVVRNFMYKKDYHNNNEKQNTKKCDMKYRGCAELKQRKDTYHTDEIRNNE